MEGSKFIEYLDPVVSSRINQSRIPFMPRGRYFGFDDWEAGGAGVGDLPITIKHSTTLEYSDTTNTLVERAVMMSPHGMVINTEEEPELALTANPSDDEPHFYRLYATYEWDNSDTHPPISYGLYFFTPASTSNIGKDEGLLDPSTEWALGYFTVSKGAASYSRVQYYPDPVPNFADGDIYEYARLNFINKFNKVNAWGIGTLDNGDLSGNGITDAAEQLNLGSDGNVLEIYLTGAVNIDGFTESTGMVGQFYVLNFQSVGTSNFVVGGNLHIPGNLAITDGDKFTFYRDTFGDFHLVSYSDTLYDIIYGLDPSNLAYLNKTNRFTKTNSEGYIVKPAADCIAGFILLFPDDCNHLVIDMAGVTTKHNISGIALRDYGTLVSVTMPNGTLISISSINNIGNNLSFSIGGGSGGGIMFPDSLNPGVSGINVKSGDTLTLRKIAPDIVTPVGPNFAFISCPGWETEQTSPAVWTDIDPGSLPSGLSVERLQYKIAGPGHLVIVSKLSISKPFISEQLTGIAIPSGYGDWVFNSATFTILGANISQTPEIRPLSAGTMNISFRNTNTGTYHAVCNCYAVNA